MKFSRLSIKILWLSALGIGIGPLAASSAVQPNSGGYTAPKPDLRLYEEGGSSKVEGKILSTDTVYDADDQEPGVRVKIDVGGSQVDVNLGPRWFLNDNAVNLTEGEPITVMGVAIRLDDHPTLIAHELQLQDRKIPLRSPAGEPLWKEAE